MLLKMSLNKQQLINLIGLAISLIIIIGIFRLAFWELNIFKKESPLPQEISEIEKEVKYISNLKLEEVANRVKQTLPSVVKPVEIPEINPNEIGKNNLFE